jgi:hypothetical protein
MARYFYIQSEIRKFNLSDGITEYFIQDMFQSKCPDRMVLALTSSAGASGDYKINPFNFSTADVSFLSVTVNGVMCGKGPYTPDFSKDIFLQPYSDLFEIHPHPNASYQPFSTGLTRDHYKGGYCLFNIDLTPATRRGNFYPTSKQGDVKLEIRFKSPLKKPMLLICQTFSPALLELDKTRNVYLSR